MEGDVDGHLVGVTVGLRDLIGIVEGTNVTLIGTPDGDFVGILDTSVLAVGAELGTALFGDLVGYFVAKKVGLAHKPEDSVGCKQRKPVQEAPGSQHCESLVHAPLLLPTQETVL